HSVGSLAVTTATDSSSAAWVTVGWAKAQNTKAAAHAAIECAFAHPTSSQTRINVPGIRLDRQRLEPMSDVVRADPARVGERLALAERRIVASKPEGLATLQAG